MPSEPHINEGNYHEYLYAVVDGERKGYGLELPVDRDTSGYATVRPFDLPLIPRDEWPERIKQMEQSKSRLSDIRMQGNFGQMIPSLDQGQSNYCWAHSPVSAALILRALDNQPYKRLSAYAVGAKIKNFANRGGWNPEAVNFVAQYGVPDIDHWPERKWDRAYDNATTWENAKLYRCTEGFWDLRLSKYDRNLTFDQLMTALISRIPCPVDFAWWSHSVMALDPVEVNANYQLNDIRRWGVRIWNSWGDNWGNFGMGVLEGSRAVPDGATAMKVMTLAG